MKQKTISWRSGMDNPLFPFGQPDSRPGSAINETAVENMTHTQAMLFARDLKQTYTAMRNAHRDLEQSYMDTINCLVLASEVKDDNTGNHLKRIGRFSTLIADHLGLSKDLGKRIGLASAMHDIGKIGIPDHILTKKGKLSKSEFAVMKTHTLIGARILAGTHSEILRLAHNIAISHHEWWDGDGYPCGLKGTDIPLEGRIVALADFFDACTSRRPYREPLPLNSVLDMIREKRGSQFEPRIVDLFLRRRKEIKELMQPNGKQ